MARIDAYLSGIYRLAAEPTAENLALKYKIRRSSISEILGRASGRPSPEAEYEYWNALEMDPIAIHTGQMRLMEKGKLYGAGQIKYPEPTLEGCISHDFRPLEEVGTRH